MKTIGISDVVEINDRLKSIGAAIHMHDTCGGQFFTLEASDEIFDQAAQLVKSFFEEKNIGIKLDRERKSFTTE